VNSNDDPLASRLSAIDERLKPRLSGRFAPGDRLCGRRGSVHAGGRPAKSLPEAISIAERFLERSIFCYAPLAVGLMDFE